MRILTRGSGVTTFAALVALAGCGDNRHFGGGQMLVSPQAGLVVTEGGGTATFQVLLTNEPETSVEVDLSSSDPAEGTVSPARLRFTRATYTEPQTVTITGVDDDLADGNQPFTIQVSGQVDYLGIVDVAVTNVDDDVPSAIVTPVLGLLTTEAGGQAQFSVALAAQPDGSVTIPIASSNPAEGVASAAMMSFTPATWAVPQTVTVTGVDDHVADGPAGYTLLLGPAESTDPAYAGLDPDDVQLTNLDDDTAGIAVTPTAGLVTGEDGTSDAFTVVLRSQPTADVTIPLSSSAPDEGTVQPASLTFTAADWDIPRTVTVTGVDDPLPDGNQLYAIVVGPATSADGSYGGYAPDDVAVTNLDDDLAGFVIDPTSGLIVSELGDTDTFTIALTVAPTADVTVPLASSDLTEGIVSPASVTFTPTSWNVPQTVTVTGVDDAVADGNLPFAIVTGPATSADPAYAGVDPADVQVTNLDDETAQVYVKVRPKMKVSENGTSATFRMRLTTTPTAPVTCTLQSSDPTEGTVAPASVTFSPASFGFQTITVTGVDDAIVDGDQVFTVETTACTSADPAYDGVDPRDIAVINRDND